MSDESERKQRIAAVDREAIRACWLIERGQSENHTPTVWWIVGPSFDSRFGERWTTDANDATPFSTKANADTVIYRLFTHKGDQSARATEHMWFAKEDTDE